MQGKTLRFSLSESKYKLFIGNIPKSLTEDDFKRVIEEIGPGSEIIDLVKVCFEPSYAIINGVNALSYRFLTTLRFSTL